ncbi:uncharacterized protein BXZ73DRAFT_82694 [Epithele typhae]|uniref:uncharacterized protein n=1 Tax=Epithele typhae TaxID=378194 RepID=UPI002008C0EB|nr:uncharacterized protein BXZ73DRAFT_82694 [Epithele typhae]KAH9911624.1 hypothetical protein BXZ73DRAFT_82694 [Epithele typhae]
MPPMLQKHRDTLYTLMHGPVLQSVPTKDLVQAMRLGLGAEVHENGGTVKVSFTPGRCRFDLKKFATVGFHKPHGGNGAKGKTDNRPDQIPAHNARISGVSVASLIGLNNHITGWDNTAWLDLCAKDWSPV